MKITFSRFLIGTALIFVGVIFLIFSYLSTLNFFILAIVAFALGIFILLNEKEDKIEERKDIKVKKSKK